VLTVDLQVLGQRHCDLRNGMTVPPEIRIRNLLDIATKAGLGGEHPARQAQGPFGNLAGHVRGMRACARSRNGSPDSSIHR